MDIIETFEHKGYEINVYHDQDCENPRETMDNLGIMVCSHPRYDLGDCHKEKDMPSFPWLEDALYDINEKKKIDFNRVGKQSFILPLYLYDHSGLAISTSRNYPFDCPWDSMIVGFICVPKEKVRKKWKVKRISKKLKAKVVDLMVAEVETYSHYLQGHCFGFEIVKDGEIVDSCWGFIGNYGDYLLETARGQIDSYDREET